MEARGMLAVLGLLFLSGAHSRNCDIPFLMSGPQSYPSTCCHAFTLFLGECCFDGGICKCRGNPSCGLSTLQPITNLCPSVPPVVGSRILNAVAVTDPCQNKGVVGLYADFSVFGPGAPSRQQFCNAVVLFNGVTNSRELIMDKECVTAGIQVIEQSGGSVFFESQGKKFTLKDCYIESKTDVGSMVRWVLDPIFSSFLDSLNGNAACDNTACAYRSSTMELEFRLGGCYLMSFGAVSIDPFNPSAVLTNGLQRANVTVVLNSACPPNSGNDPDLRCVQLDGSATLCTGDISAALFCPLTTNEEVFMGLLNTTDNSCVGTQTTWIRLYNTEA